MNPIGDNYFERLIYSYDIPDREMFQSAYFQVQIVATDAEGTTLLRTEVFEDLATLQACGSPGGGQSTQPTPRPTTQPVPTPTPTRPVP